MPWERQLNINYSTGDAGFRHVDEGSAWSKNSGHFEYVTTAVISVAPRLRDKGREAEEIFWIGVVSG